MKPVYWLFLIIFVWVLIVGGLSLGIAFDERTNGTIDWLKAAGFIIAAFTVIGLTFSEGTRKITAFVYGNIAVLTFGVCVFAAVMWWREVFDFAFIITVLATATAYFCLLNTSRTPDCDRNIRIVYPF